MSLDVYLKSDAPFKIKGGSGIFVRRNGQTVEISKEEWDIIYPGIPPVQMDVPEEMETDVLFEYNITHNLNKMADAAGLYEYLWRPEEKHITKAGELITPLSNGLRTLVGNPDEFKQHNPENGWGDYDGLVKFVEKYLIACIKYPESTIEVSR